MALPWPCYALWGVDHTSVPYPSGLVRSMVALLRDWTNSSPPRSLHCNVYCSSTQEMPGDSSSCLVQKTGTKSAQPSRVNKTVLARVLILIVDTSRPLFVVHESVPPQLVPWTSFVCSLPQYASTLQTTPVDLVYESLLILAGQQLPRGLYSFLRFLPHPNIDLVSSSPTSSNILLYLHLFLPFRMVCSVRPSTLHILHLDLVTLRCATLLGPDVVQHPRHKAMTTQRLLRCDTS